MVTATFEVDGFCEELGLKGKLIDSIKSVVKSKSDLEKFKLFIIENDGKFRSNLQLVHKFVTTFDFKTSYPCRQFVFDYLNVSKELALKSISRGFYSNVVLHKVGALIDNGLTLKELYDKVISEENNIIQVLNYFFNKKVDIPV